jgi:hypothetical protein
MVLETMPHSICLQRLETYLVDVLKPNKIIIAAANREFNPIYNLHGAEKRDEEHMFEWSRDEFSAWVNQAFSSSTTGYDVSFSSVGSPPENSHHGDVGDAVQLCVLTKQKTKGIAKKPMVEDAADTTATATTTSAAATSSEAATATAATAAAAAASPSEATAAAIAATPTTSAASTAAAPCFAHSHLQLCSASVPDLPSRSRRDRFLQRFSVHELDKRVAFLPMPTPLPFLHCDALNWTKHFEDFAKARSGVHPRRHDVRRALLLLLRVRRTTATAAAVPLPPSPLRKRRVGLIIIIPIINKYTQYSVRNKLKFIQSLNTLLIEKYLFSQKVE